MKITLQTDQTLEAKQSATAILVVALIIIVAGIGLVIALTGVTLKDDNGNASGFPSWAIGSIVAAVGVLMLLLAKSTKMYLNKSGESYYETKYFLFPAKRQTFQLQEVSGVRFNSTTTMDYNTSSSAGASSSPTPVTRSLLMLVFRDGSQMVVGQSNGKGGIRVNGISLGMLRQKAPMRDEAEKIAVFIGVPLQAEDVSGISAAINTIGGYFQQNQPTTQALGEQAPEQTPSTIPQSPPSQVPQQQSYVSTQPQVPAAFTSGSPVQESAQSPASVSSPSIPSVPVSASSVMNAPAATPPVAVSSSNLEKSEKNIPNTPAAP